MTVDQRLHLRPNGYKQTNAHRHKWRTSHLWSFSNPFLLECLRRIELDMFMCFTDWRRYLTECFSDSLSFPVSPLKGVNVLPLFYWAGFSQSISLSLSFCSTHSLPLSLSMCFSFRALKLWLLSFPVLSSNQQKANQSCDSPLGK